MGRQYQVGIKHSNGDHRGHVVFAESWSDISKVVEANFPGSEIVEYVNAPKDFDVKYPELMTDPVRRNFETQKRLREIFGK